MLRTLILTLVAALSVLSQASANSPSPTAGSSNDATFNYGLSSFLGSGIYSINGQTVQLYRIPFSADLDNHSADKPHFSVQLPVTFGFYNFQPQDVLSGQIPKSLDTLSVLAGIDGNLPLSETWHYLQLVAVGYTRSAGLVDKKLTGTQIALERTAPWNGWVTRYRSEVLGALSSGGPTGTDRVLRLLQGVEFDRPQSWDIFRHQAAIGTYGVVRWFPGPFAYTPTHSAIRLETEAGITFGTAEPIRIFRLPLPRLSLGYRRAADLNVVFLGFGTPF